MKKYRIGIVGKTPYMQCRMDDQTLEEWEKNRKLIIERPDVSKEDLTRALFHSYQDDEGFYIPSEQIRQSLINAGSFVKAKVGNAKKSMKNVVAGMFFINPERIRLSKESFQIDKRSAVNRSIHARVIVIRPRWDKWSVEFELSVDNDTITEETIKQIFEYAGNYVGIGSYRPQNNGQYGRFETVKFEEMK